MEVQTGRKTLHYQLLSKHVSELIAAHIKPANLGTDCDQIVGMTDFFWSILSIFMHLPLSTDDWS